MRGRTRIFRSQLAVYVLHLDPGLTPIHIDVVHILDDISHPNKLTIVEHTDLDMVLHQVLEQRDVQLAEHRNCSQHLDCFLQE